MSRAGAQLVQRRGHGGIRNRVGLELAKQALPELVKGLYLVACAVVRQPVEQPLVGFSQAIGDALLDRGLQALETLKLGGCGL